MIYLESSALVKLVVAEPESSALRAYLAGQAGRVSSQLTRVEVLRAVRRANRPETTLRRAERTLERIALIPLDEPTLARAAALDPPALRSLDAIHLATALSIDRLDAVVTYDRRLADAAADAGLTVASPA